MSEENVEKQFATGQNEFQLKCNITVQLTLILGGGDLLLAYVDKNRVAFEYEISAVNQTPLDTSVNKPQGLENVYHDFPRDEKDGYGFKSAILPAGGPLGILDTATFKEKQI